MYIEENDIYIFLGEVIENGYNYKKCLEASIKKWSLTFEQAGKIHYIMENHNFSKDCHYEKFNEDLKEILEK